MNTRLFPTLSILALTLIGSASAFGQSILEADIPFRFQAGATEQAAGKYFVTPETSGVVVLTNGATGHTNFVLSTPANIYSASGKQYLVFKRAGSYYRLVTIFKRGAELRIPPTREQNDQEAAAHTEGEIIAQVVVPLL